MESLERGGGEVKSALNEDSGMGECSNDNPGGCKVTK